MCQNKIADILELRAQTRRGGNFLNILTFFNCTFVLSMAYWRPAVLNSGFILISWAPTLYLCMGTWKNAITAHITSCNKQVMPCIINPLIFYQHWNGWVSNKFKPVSGNNLFWLLAVHYYVKSIVDWFAGIGNNEAASLSFNTPNNLRKETRRVH